VSSIDLSEISLPGLKGKRVLVTGGASGIGRSAAFVAAYSGAQVVAGDMNESALADLELEAKAANLDIRAVLLDVSSPESVRGFVATGDQPLSGVVCSAGIAPDVPTLDMTLEMWNRVIAVNLTGVFLVSQAAAQVMVEQGEGGSIVVVASAMGTTGALNLAHYSASKAGAMALTRSLARELGPHQIRFNAVSPGGINTPLYKARMTDEQVRQNIGRMPLGRLGEPEDVAKAIGFMLSDLSSWITGQTLNVNGGSLMLT
jgi:NAD(P)-dependent dehydrogenase (short-subunit alcohol dehydrogenase family)